MNGTTKKLAEQAIEEAQVSTLSELMKDEKNIKISQILAIMGVKKEKVGPIEFSLQFGRECWDKGREEMKKELSNG